MFLKKRKTKSSSLPELLPVLKGVRKGIPHEETWDLDLIRRKIGGKTGMDEDQL